jgi:hypothetical protein
MRDLLRILALIAALCIVGIGAVLGLVGLAVSLISDGPDMLMLVTSSASVLLLSVGLGSAAAWHAWRAIQGSPSAAFRPTKIWLLVALFVLALVLGQTMLSLSVLPALTFPLFHIGATVLPALIILALVGRSLGGVTTWRELVLQTASGAFLATPLAFILEGVAILLIGIAAFLGLAWLPGGQDLILRLTTYLQDPSVLQDPGALAPALSAPSILVAAFAVVAGLIPLIEEAVKTIGVALMGYRRPSLPQAVLWGLAAGAGFAAAEGLLNASGGIGASWLPVVSLRVGTTLLHCLTGALMGLAWYQIFSRQRWFRGLVLYAASVAVHGLWNGLALSMALISLGALGASSGGASQAAVGFGAIAILLLLGVLGLGLAGGVAGVTAYARRQSQPLEPASEGTASSPLEVLATEAAKDED